MQQSSHPQHDESLNPRQTLNLFTMWLITHVTPLEALFRVPGTIGVRYFGMEAFWAFLYLPLFGAVASGMEGKGQGLFLIFWGLYVVLLIIHRASSNTRLNEGCKNHTRYIGDSWFGSLSLRGFQDDQRAKTFLEPLACVVLGLLCMPFCPALGWYFLIGTVSLAVPLMLIHRRDRVRKLDQQDAAIESAQLRQWAEKDAA